ncbi:replicative DNA helicase [Christensenellaceae bacterium OttesenSCG-928-K19]|nr:replicative DNA helicase [Christensenellaceae bacterium OttesenSCG-928-K19]
MPEQKRKDMRMPPSSMDAEQSILGSMLLNAKCVDEALVFLRPEDFHYPKHRDIFAAMVHLMETGVPVDIVTVAERLEQEGKMHIGGIEYLTELTDVVPSVANIGHYIKIVEEKSTLRKLIDTSMNIADDCYKGEDDADIIVGRAGDQIYQIAVKDARNDVKPIRQALQEGYLHISEAAKSKDGLMGLPTGFGLMDKMLSGLQGTQLIVIAGRPGMGKTSFALNIVEHIARVKEVPSLIFSLEMSADQLATRLMCSEAKVDSQVIRTGRMGTEEIKKLAEAMKLLSAAPIFIDDSPTITVTEMLAKAHRLKRTEGLGLIAIDYLQLMQGTGRSENRQQEVSNMTRSLKIMAKELNVPILLLSQLSRASEKRDKKARYPMLSDLRESGAIEQDADVVIFLQREDYYPEDKSPETEGKARIMIAKQRNGPTGNIQVQWQGEFTKYVEIDYIHDDQEAPF